MERRPYFVFGDIFACVLAGGATGWLVYALIPGDWFGLIAMFVGMSIGMVIGMLVGLILAPFFGDLEVMLPASYSGMLAGMIIGMGISMAPAVAGSPVGVGALAGLFCFAYTYILQARLRGVVRS